MPIYTKQTGNWKDWTPPAPARRLTPEEVANRVFRSELQDMTPSERDALLKAGACLGIVVRS